MQQETTTGEGADWFVMIHLSPSFIELMLNRENSGQLVEKEKQNLPSFRFFIPFQFMRTIPTRAMNAAEREQQKQEFETAENYELRNDFKHFVFISASDERIQQLLQSDWNTKGRLHLYHYRDRQGNPIKIKDSEIQCLKDTFLNRQLKFFFRQPLESMSKGDEVTLNVEPWVGWKGIVEKIDCRNSHCTMRVSVNIMHRMQVICFEDIHEGEVVFEDAEKARLINGDLIANFEEELLTILLHRYKNNVRTQRDWSMLTRMLGFMGIAFDNTDDKLRFMSIMLMCAHLLNETAVRDRLQRELEETVGSLYEATTATEAYALLALFVCTRNPKIRDAVKAYRKTHADSTDILRRYLRRVRHLKCQKPTKSAATEDNS